MTYSNLRRAEPSILLWACSAVVIATSPPFSRQTMLSLKMSRIELKSSDLKEYDELKLKKHQTSSKKEKHGESVNMEAEGHTTPLAAAKTPTTPS